MEVVWPQQHFTTNREERKALPRYLIRIDQVLLVVDFLAFGFYNCQSALMACHTAGRPRRRSRDGLARVSDEAFEVAPCA